MYRSGEEIIKDGDWEFTSAYPSAEDLKKLSLKVRDEKVKVQRLAAIVVTTKLPLALFHHSISYFTSTLIDLFLAMFALGLAIGVTIAVGILAIYQLLAIGKNQTGIESWIVAKADHWRSDTGAKPFVYPYDLGRTNNVLQVLTWSGRAVGDGIHWPLRDGCGEYDLTVRVNFSDVTSVEMLDILVIIRPPLVYPGVNDL
ncbi:unnamed protein product [Echinostoma caproni]|uniref:Transmembrane protein n=1 Tax=Echinostoma caproni TaxID=27848 RepID=A0A183AIK8_9TREM|nr:unnamed protein product [Echinostoma caproni]